MFFLIGGLQPKTIIVDKRARPCPACGHFEAFLKRVDHYVSLFFIPLFPVKKGAPFLVCENCKTVFDEHGSKMGAGHTISEKRCAQCGSPLSPEFTFCPYCGKAL